MQWLTLVSNSSADKSFPAPIKLAILFTRPFVQQIYINSIDALELSSYNVAAKSSENQKDDALTTLLFLSTALPNLVNPACAASSIRVTIFKYSYCSIVSSVAKSKLHTAVPIFSPIIIPLRKGQISQQPSQPYSTKDLIALSVTEKPTSRTTFSATPYQSCDKLSATACNADFKTTSVVFFFISKSTRTASAPTSTSAQYIPIF